MGTHCQEGSCKQLDYLPMKCDACSGLYCKDHLLYDDHACAGKYKKDVQVPVCPLCSAPVAVARGALPDLAVSSHIDQGCPEKKKQKVFTNRCQRVAHGKQCKKHELVACVCASCKSNFCLAHRHPADHECPGPGQRAGKAAGAADQRAKSSSSSGSSNQAKITNFFTGPFRPTETGQPSAAAAAAMARQQRSATTNSRSAPARTPVAANPRQMNGMSEDEALAAALAASLETGPGTGSANGHPQQEGLTQEQEDLALARALQESEQMQRNRSHGQRQGQGVGSGDKACSLQ